MEAVRVEEKADLSSPHRRARPGYSPESRVAPRPLKVPVEVSGNEPAPFVDGRPQKPRAFREETATTIVFPQGAVVQLSVPVQEGQRIVLTNCETGQKVPSTVLRVKNRDSAKSYVEIEFDEPAERFWGQWFSRGSKPNANSSATVAAPKLAEVLPSVAAPVPSAAPPLLVPSASGSAVGAKLQPVESADQSALKAKGNGAIPKSSPLEPFEPAPTPAPAAIQLATPRAPRTSIQEPQEANNWASSEALLPLAPVTLPQRTAQPLNPASVTARTARRPSFYSFSFLSTELLRIRAGYHSAQAVTKKTLFTRYKVAIVSIASVLVSGSGIAGIYFGQRSALKSEPVEVQSAAVSTAAASDIPAPEAPKENSASMPARRAATAERVARSEGESSGPAAEVPPTEAEKATATSAPVDKNDYPTAQVAATKQDSPSGLSTTLNESLPQTGELSTPSLGLVAPVASLPATAESGKVLSQPARTGGNLQEPRLISSSPPDYPFVAKQVGIEGAVVVNGVIDASGRVTQMKAISGPALLRGAAIDAIRKWKYEPTVLNGNIVPIEVNITVQFRLH